MATVEGKVAKRYARALFELTAVPDLDRMNDGLKGIAAVFGESLELRHALLNPGVPLAERVAAAQDVARVAGGDVVTLQNFMGVLLENSRVELLAEIAKEFAALVAHVKKILALEVISAFPLSEGERQEIQARMQNDFGSLAALSWSVDPALVGGLVIKSGDRQLDGSVKGALERAREALLEA